MLYTCLNFGAETVNFCTAIHGSRINLIFLDRFEPGERRELFDVDFSQEFSIEKKVKDRKRPLEKDSDEEEDDMEKGDMMDVDEDEELEDWSEDVEVKINIKVVIQ